MNKSASFSTGKVHRFFLCRVWDESLPVIMCIGLNPSTADHIKDDPTIRILVKVLTRLGYGGFYMTNLFTIVSSDPSILLKSPSSALFAADEYLLRISNECKNNVIFCWGNFKQAQERSKEVINMFPVAKCFGYTKSGAPIHPMSLMYSGKVNSATLIDFK